jgi:dipeptidyl aminopeptidase/acylaminoacyl peptidase
MKNTIIFILTIMVTSLNAQNFIGDWKGQLSVQGMQMEIIFHISEKDNQFTTTLDVPMQGAAGITLDKTDIKGAEISIVATKMGINFNGQLKEKTIEGIFKQSGMDLPLTLTKFESKLPGDTQLPSSNEDLLALRNLDKGACKYKVSDYFAKPKASGFKLSPNGQFLSYREKDEKNKRHIYVKNIKSGVTNRAIEEKEELVRDYGWINNERLYFSMDKGGDENYHIYAVNLDGSNLKDMTPFDGVTASISKILKDQKDYIIISMNKNNKQVFEPYKLNVVTGDLVQLFENKDIENPIQGFEFDKDGELRGYTKLINGVTNELYYKNLTTGAFNLIATSKWDDTFNILSFNYASKNANEAYMMTNLDSNITRIVLYDLANKKVLKEVFSNPTFDVSGLSLSRKRNWEIDNFSFEGEKFEIIPISKLYKTIYSQMEKEFPNKEAYIVDYDDNEDNFLIVVQSDKLYGKYYQYDVKTKKFSLLFDLMPQLKEGDMAEMRPIKFKSRDGLTIYGYITLPKDALAGKKVPLVVNPHGGPQGVRDSWGFNPETQLYASRGYATLQVNFRISGGYGKEFLRAGFKQIGRKLMDDVEDGVKYAIEQGWVDKDKMAIYGGSHGGYATLMGLVKTPELYTCGVNYVGVSNIFTFFESFPEYWKPYKEIVKEIWYDLDKPEEAAIAKQVSPVFQVDKIVKPLFVIQGANDPRVKIAESDQIVTKLRAKGFDVPYMVKYDEGHGFGKEGNSIEMYEATLGFLSKYLK